MERDPKKSNLAQGEGEGEGELKELTFANSRDLLLSARPSILRRFDASLQM